MNSNSLTGRASPGQILAVALIICLGISLFVNLVYAPETFSDGGRLLFTMLVNMGIGAIYFATLWPMSNYLNRHHPWLKNPVRRLLLEFVGLVTIVFLVTTTLNIGVGMWRGKTAAQVWQALSFADFVNLSYLPIIVTMFMEARGFLKEWRQSLLRTERLRLSNLQARHSYLQHQIKPHFLFNSLNVLTSLVHKDANLAEQFIHELARLYRRLLEVNQRELIPLSEEMEALRSYVFLVKMRFGEALQVDLPADLSGLEERLLPPFTLQLLLENVVKHNDMAKDQPLQVTIRLDVPAGTATVSNTLRPKTRLDEPSTGLGLKNLRERYELIAERQLAVVSADGVFQVTIPLLASDELRKLQRKSQWRTRKSGKEEEWSQAEYLLDDKTLMMEEKWRSKKGDKEQVWEQTRRKRS